MKFFAKKLATIANIAYICHRKWEILTMRPKIINVMKKKFLWMMAAIMTCCISFTLASCSVDDNVTPTPKPEPAPVDPTIEPIDPVRCEATVDLGDISGLSAELQTALKKRMTNLVSSGEEAAISFCVAGEKDKFDSHLKKGTTAIVVAPAVGGDFSEIAKLAGGVLPSATQMPILFYATQKYGQHYLMLDGGEPDNLETTEEKVDFYERRIIPLIHWLNKVEALKEKRHLQEEAAQNGQQPYDYDDLTANIDNDGLSLTCNLPYSQESSFDFLGDIYRLKASSSIDFGLRVYPIYKQSCHQEKSGDYYVVTTEITPYNQGMWKPYNEKISILHDRMFVIGYWFYKMHTAFKLVDMDGNDIPGIEYNLKPLPENEIDSHQYSDGTSTTIGGSASAGFSGSSPTGSLGFSFSHTVSSSLSYSMDDIEYTLDSSTKEVKYDYNSKNVDPQTDDDTDTHFPKNCRTQWTVRQAWVWFVPRGQAGVDDNSNVNFQIALNGELSYRSWWWVWHPISPNESGDISTFTPLKIENQTWQLQAPNRESWGLTSIKSEYTNAVMANIKYYVSGHESEDPVQVDQMSYHQNDFALMGLPEGTYTIIYETKDPNTGAHMDSWKFENVEVKQGRDKDEATTALSSVNATKIDE